MASISSKITRPEERGDQMIDLVWSTNCIKGIGIPGNKNKNGSQIAQQLIRPWPLFWCYMICSLYTQIPCSDGEVQTVTLHPGRIWRFQSPNFPSIRGYPDSLECTWRFRADHRMIGDVQITCDHFDVDGNVYQSCKNADYIAARHVLNNDTSNGTYEGDSKLCGDLTSWIPLSAHWHRPKGVR